MDMLYALAIIRRLIPSLESNEPYLQYITNMLRAQKMVPNIFVFFFWSQFQFLQGPSPSSSPNLHPASINIFPLDYLHFFISTHISLFIVGLLEDTHTKIGVFLMTHFIKHNFVYIYVLRPSSFQRRGWRETEDMEVPGRHTLPLYP